MKTQKIRCQECKERFTYYRIGAGRPPSFCPGCIVDRERDQARLRMALMRQRQGRAEQKKGIG